MLAVAVDVAGHMLAAKARKKFRRDLAASAITYTVNLYYFPICYSRHLSGPELFIAILHTHHFLRCSLHTAAFVLVVDDLVSCVRVAVGDLDRHIVVAGNTHRGDS